MVTKLESIMVGIEQTSLSQTEKNRFMLELLFVSEKSGGVGLQSPTTGAPAKELQWAFAWAVAPSGFWGWRMVHSAILMRQVA